MEAKELVRLECWVNSLFVMKKWKHLFCGLFFKRYTFGKWCIQKW